MKTKALFFALLVAVTTTAFGNDAPGMTVVSFRGSEVFKVIYKGASTGKVKLNILDAEGKVIHSETISGTNGFICPVNFKGLVSGTYTIQVVDNAGKYQEEVSYKPAADLKGVHVSKLVREQGKYLLAISNAQNESVQVRIFDGDERIVYNETRTLNGDFAQVFKMQNPASRYTFEVSDQAGNKKYFNF